MADDTLFLCPCCNKLVSADHFMRPPLSKEDVIALSLHPIIERRLRRLIRDEIMAMPQPELVHAPGPGRRVVKDAPPGYITYAEACTKYGLSNNTVRQLVHHGKITGKGGLILEMTLRDFLVTFKPRAKRSKANDGGVPG